MDNSFKNRNLLVIVFEVLIIILGVGGITFATSKLIGDRSTTTITFGNYNVDYKGDLEVVAKDLEPMDDELVNYNTVDNVIRLEFSLRGVSTNKNEDLIYDVMLNEMNIDCSLLNKYTKWNLYKNGSLLSSGSLDPAFDGNVLSENMRLTNIQEDLPRYDEDYDNYVLIFWISEACDDLETCELVDQSEIVNSKMSMNVFIALYGGNKKAFERVPNYDTACVNKPNLYNNMIAVNYKDGNFVVADSSNSIQDNLWYDYGNQKWANAVIVNGNKYNEVGTVVKSEDILGYYVWVPRYRYKLWNVEEDVSDSYQAYDEGIDIIFETGLNNISVDSYENDKYMTHPAFGTDLRGFWISKYEVSMNGNRYLSVPGRESYMNASIDSYKTIGDGLVDSYKLGRDANSRMINNMEWGATLYLSHSKYGVCSDNGCVSISMNNSYVSGTDKQDTTTRNVYGVYDMAGGSSEYVIGVSGVGSAMDEVVLDTGISWYGAQSVSSNSDYLIRGGCNKGLFYYGGLGMSDCSNSTRFVLY